MKKLLFISSRPLFPIVGGDQIRTVQCLELLKEYFEIHILFLTDKFETDDILAKYSLYGTYKSFYLNKFQFYLHALHFLYNKKPIQVNYYYSQEVQKYIDNIISSYDVVFCNNIRTAEYVRKYNIDKIIDFVDAISMNYKNARNSASFIKRLIYEIDYKRCLYYEQIILNEFNASSIISEIDKEYLLNIATSPKNINVIGNMVNWESPITSNFNTENNIISFIGKMNYEPNIVAVTYFVNNIFPLIKKIKNNVKFYIVGTSPSKSVMKLHNGHDIFVTGFVPDVREYFLKSAIIVAPMLSGAGIQNKIIQAMSLGCCVVTTSIGAEGLNICNNEIAIENDNKNFASTILSLLDNPNKRHQMGELAKVYVYNNLSQQAIKENFYEFIKPFI